jgi:hypothetical protein
VACDLQFNGCCRVRLRLFIPAASLLTLPAGAAGLQVDAGVADQLVLGDPTAPRFVYWDKKLRPTPSGEHPASQTVSQPASQPVDQPGTVDWWRLG